jgi:hypothetical protein
MKPKPLLMFLNARGRHLPWTFAGTEDDFCLLARMPPCMDDEFCNRNNLSITRSIQPGIYGAFFQRNDGSVHYHGNADSYEMCARTGLLALSMQSRILDFLVQCANTILHDLHNNGILAFPIQDEPPFSEVAETDDSGHTKFSDVLMGAPYHGSNSLNFAKLGGYISSTFDAEKERMWALREDPSYFAEAVAEFEEHVGADPLKPTSRLSDKISYRASILTHITVDAYVKLAAWQELDRHFCEFNRLHQANASIRVQIDAVSGIQKVAKWMKNALAGDIFTAASSVTNIRKLWHRAPDQLTEGQAHMLHCLRAYSTPEQLLDTPMIICSNLQVIDMLMQTHPECKAMITGHILSLLAEISIIAECLRQVGLWERSPEVRWICSCQRLGDQCSPELDRLQDFLAWSSRIQEFAMPIHHVYPYREKLAYPVNKRRTRTRVDAMRQAEANLDKFWKATDSMFENETGIPQHHIIRDCLNEGGEVQRTAPWVEQIVPEIKPKTEKPEYMYQPFSRMVHDKALQITGAFDKLSIEESTKTKTRGISIHEGGPVNEILVQPFQSLSEKVEKPFLVDQRTHKVFKTIFYTPTTDTGDLPKVVKWAEFKRAMTRVGFAMEKLQGSAWQFTPGVDSNAERNIQFHEPHPDSDVPYVMAKRFGRRLGRVYGWSTDTFKLA